MRRSAAPSQLAKRPRFQPPTNAPLISSSASTAPDNYKRIKLNSSQSITTSPAIEKDEPAPPTCMAAPQGCASSEDILALFNCNINNRNTSTVKASFSSDKELYDDNLDYSKITAGEIERKENKLPEDVLLTSYEQSSSSIATCKDSLNNSYNTQLSNIDSHKTSSFLSTKTQMSTNNSGHIANKNSIEKDSNNTCYFSVVWCKRSARKHKKWEGDAVLIVKSRSVTLKDLEGKVIGQSSGYKLADLTSLEDGNTLPVGGKEVEIQGSISSEEYSTGRCFLGGDNTNTAAAAPVTVKLPKPKPFKLPTKGGGESCGARSGGPASRQPLYQATHHHSLVFPRPRIQQQFLEGGDVTDVVLDPLLSAKLRPHQRDGVIFLYQCVMGHRSVGGVEGATGCILADEMGLGKTLQCIALVWTLMKQSPIRSSNSNTGAGVVRRVLVVTPSSLVNNWAKEFHKWLGKERIQVFTVDHNNKVEQFLRQQVSRVLIISYDMLLRSQATLASSNCGFGLLICDEAHRLKNSSSRTTQLLSSLPVRRRVLLTGTPLQNDMQELYSLSDVAIPGSLGSSTAFRRLYEEPISEGHQTTSTEVDRELGRARVSELKRITSSFILRRTQEIINRYLPPKVEWVVFCQASSSQLHLYKELTALITRRFGAGGGSMDHLSAIMLLRKLCNHPALLHKGRCGDSAGSDNQGLEEELSAAASALLPHHLQQLPLQYSEEDSGKLAVLSCLLWQLHQDGPREKVVVVSHFTSTLDLLEAVCRRYGYLTTRLDGSTQQAKRQAIVDEFNSKHSKYFVFLLSSRAGGVGLNLIGASRIVLYDIDWNPATDLQAMARIWRDGQTKRVHIYRLLVSGTVEERMYQRQVHKQGLSGVVVDARGRHGAMTDDNKVNFSQQELKDLFNGGSVGACLTHALLHCCCDLRGGPATQAPLEQSPTRACQLIRSPPSTNTMDQLYQWQHFAAPHIHEGAVQDPCLEAAADFINLVFRNESQPAPAE